jgi:hypothetical protein
MTNKELQELLKQLPDDLPIYIERNGAWQDIALSDTTKKYCPSKQLKDYRYLMVVPN